MNFDRTAELFKGSYRLAGTSSLLEGHSDFRTGQHMQPTALRACRPLSRQSWRQSRRNPWRGLLWEALAVLAVTVAGSLSVPARAQDPSPAASIDANKLAREVMYNEVAAQGRDQSLWSYHEVRDKDGKKEGLQVCQTKAGEIQRLVSIDGRPLNNAERHAEDVRIHNLLTHPDQMQREVKKRHEDAEQARAMMKMFPDAFRFKYAGKQGDLVRLDFTPNPNFHPSGHAAQVFYHMRGTLLVNPKEKRLAEISGQLTSEVKFGGGVFGHLDKGGTFLVKQQDVGSGHWEVTVMDIQMRGKALFFKSIDVAEKELYSNFKPVTAGITPEKAAQLVAENAESTSAQQN